MRRKKIQGDLSRRKVLKYGLYGSLSAALSSSLWVSGCGKTGPKKKLNVLVVSIDTLRADHVSCYGYGKPTTPNADRLAEEGHVWSRAYTTMPTTLPAHTSMFTSLYPRQLSVRRNGDRIPEKAVMLAQLLQSKGYSTGGFVSGYSLSSRYGFNRGFETFMDIRGMKVCPAEVTLGRALKWLAEHRDDLFFLFAHLFDPHTSYHAPGKFRAKFGAPNKAEPPEFDFLKNPGYFTLEKIRDVTAAYDAEIAYADWAFGQLRRKVSELGLDESTIIVLTSDHGESLDELLVRYNYGFDHGEFMYAHQLHIPMIIYVPTMEARAKEQRVHTVPVSIVDVMPTLLELLDIKHAAGMVGNSLVPMLYGKKMSRGPVFSERRIFKEAPKPYLGGDDCSIIKEKWHLIYSTASKSELYNIEKDPLERMILSSEEAEFAKLNKQVQQWRQKTRPLYFPSGFETDPKAMERLRSLGYIE